MKSGTSLLKLLNVPLEGQFDGISKKKVLVPGRRRMLDGSDWNVFFSRSPSLSLIRPLPDGIGCSQLVSPTVFVDDIMDVTRKHLQVACSVSLNLFLLRLADGSFTASPMETARS